MILFASLTFTGLASVCDIIIKTTQSAAAIAAICNRIILDILFSFSFDLNVFRSIVFSLLAIKS
jgi:hypothetical protein